LLAAVARRLRPDPRQNDEVERATDAITVEAQRQIDLQYQTADGQDVKTMGMVAAAVAAAALISATQHDWSPRWTIPLLILIGAIACFVKSLWQRDFERGPRLPAFYRTFRGTMLAAKGDILSELIRALEHNEAQLTPKAWWYAVGCWGLALSGWATAIVMIRQL
jgi:hypothetical protein